MVSFAPRVHVICVQCYRFHLNFHSTKIEFPTPRDYLRRENLKFSNYASPSFSPSNNIYSDKMCKPSLNTILKFDLALTENRFLSLGLHRSWHGRKMILMIFYAKRVSKFITLPRLTMRSHPVFGVDKEVAFGKIEFHNLHI